MVSRHHRLFHQLGIVMMIVGLLAPLATFGGLTFAQDATPPPPPESMPAEGMQPSNQPEVQLDSDGDGVSDDVDICPAGDDAIDTDADGSPDACDATPNGEEPPPVDTDGDGMPDGQDNCVQGANPDQADLDGDGIGDACDPLNDADGDGVDDVVATQSAIDAANAQATEDAMAAANAQATEDARAAHEAREAEEAARTATGGLEIHLTGSDGAVLDGGATLRIVDKNGAEVVVTDGVAPGDADGVQDGVIRVAGIVNGPVTVYQTAGQAGYAFDPGAVAANAVVAADVSTTRVDITNALLDADYDGVLDGADNCAAVANPEQVDTDADGVGDACDPDIDGDGLTNEEEAALGTDPYRADTDGHGVRDDDEVAAGTDPLVVETGDETSAGSTPAGDVPASGVADSTPEERAEIVATPSGPDSGDDVTGTPDAGADQGSSALAGAAGSTPVVMTEATPETDTTANVIATPDADAQGASHASPAASPQASPMAAPMLRAASMDAMSGDGCPILLGTSGCLPGEGQAGEYSVSMEEAPYAIHDDNDRMHAVDITIRSDDASSPTDIYLKYGLFAEYGHPYGYGDSWSGPEDWECDNNISPGILYGTTCTGTVPADGSVTIRLNVMPVESACSDYTSKVVVYLGPGLEHPQISASNNVHVLCQDEPWVDLQALPEGYPLPMLGWQVPAGETLAYRVTAENLGVGVASDFSFTATLPDVPHASWTVDTDGCTVSGGSVQCAFGDLEPGESITVTISTGTLDAVSCGAWAVTVSSETTGTGSTTSPPMIVTCDSGIVVAVQGVDQKITQYEPAVFAITVANYADWHESDLVQNPSLDVDLSASIGFSPEWTILDHEFDRCVMTTATHLDCSSFGSVGASETLTVWVQAGTTNGCGWVHAAAVGTSSPLAGGSLDRTSQSSGTIRVLCQPEITFPTAHSCPDTTGLSLGDSVTIKIYMVNEGDIRQSFILTSIGRPGTLEEPFKKSLNPGEVVVRSFTTEITREDWDAQAITLDITAFLDSGILINGELPVLANTTISCDYGVPSVLTVDASAPASVLPGDTLAYTFEIWNYGDEDLTDATVTMTLPAMGTTWSLEDDPSCSRAGDVITCTGVSIWASDLLGKTIIVETIVPDDNSVCGEQEASLTADPLSGTAASGATSTVVNCDATGTLSLNGPATVKTGDVLWYEISGTFVGGAEDSGVYVRPLVEPETFRYLLPVTGSDWNAEITSTEGVDGDTWCGTMSGGSTYLDCGLTDLAPGNGSFVIRIESVVTNELTCGESVTNQMQAAFEGGTGDGNVELSNIVETEVECAPVLSIEKSGSSGTVPGGEVYYDITVSNSGTGTATGVTIVDDLPDGGEVSVTSPGTGCEIGDGNVVTCSNLAVAGNNGTIDGSVTVELTYTVPASSSACADISNVATYQVGAGDAIESNTHTTTVTCVADVAVEITRDEGMIEPGAALRYYITISNSGHGVANDVGLEAQLPSEIAGHIDWEDKVWGIVSTKDELCSLPEYVLNCDGITLAPSGEEGDTLEIAVVTFSVDRPSLELCETGYTASVELTGEWTGSSTVTTPIDCLMDWEFSVVPSAASIPHGDQAEFTATATNVSGEGDAAQVTLTLPDTPGLTWSVTDHDFESCVTFGVFVTCTTYSDIPDTESRFVKVASTPVPVEACNSTLEVSAGLLVTRDAWYLAQASLAVECPPEAATIPTITVVQAACVDGAVTESSVTIGEDGAGIIAAVDPTEPQDGSVAHEFVVTLTLENGYAWPTDMAGWTVDGNTATQVVTTEAAECPPEAVPVELSLTSSDPAAISRMPEGSTWTVTSVDDASISFSGTFTGDQLELPTVLLLPEPLLPGTYLVEIDATPAFEPFSAEFTVGGDQARRIAVQGFFAQAAPETVSVPIVLQAVDPDDGGTDPDPTPTEPVDPDPTPTEPTDPDDGDRGDQDPTPEPTDPTDPDDGEGDAGDGGTAPDPDDGTEDGPDDGKSVELEADASNGTIQVRGLPSTGEAEIRRSTGLTWVAMATVALVLAVGAAGIRRRR